MLVFWKFYNFFRSLTVVLIKPPRNRRLKESANARREHFTGKQLFICSFLYLHMTTLWFCLSGWPRGLRFRSAAAPRLRLWVRIPPGGWNFFCCDCCVLSGRGLRDEMITHPDESYRLWCVVVCDLETSWRRRPWPTEGCRAKNKLLGLLLLQYIPYSNSWLN